LSRFPAWGSRFIKAVAGCARKPVGEANTANAIFAIDRALRRGGDGRRRGRDGRVHRPTQGAPLSKIAEPGKAVL
jgi:hypothetical protein